MRAKFIFYGIGRGLNVSMPSIERKLIDKCKKYFSEISILHLVQIEDNLSNERSGDFGKISKIEGNTFYDKKPVFIDYNPKKQSCDLYKRIKNSLCMHGDNHKSSINLLKQLNLLNSKSIKVKNDEVLIFCRDDIYIDSFDKNIFKYSKKLKTKEYIVSCYDWQNGISDRFFISRGNTANLLKNRINHIDELINKEKGINGERLMKFVSDRYNLKPIAFNIKFKRVRLNDSLVNERRYFPFHRPSEILRLINAFKRNFFIRIR